MSAVMTDAALLARWRAGCRESGSVLIDRYFGVVHRFFENKVNGELRDLVQQTFLACMEARNPYDGRASFKGYLLAIARNQLFMHYGRQRRHPLAGADASVRDGATSPSGVLARREDEQLLGDALRRVPLEAQMVLELAFWEGLDGAEIARVLEVPLNTAYSRLRRAKGALRAVLAQMSPDRLGAARMLARVPEARAGRRPALARDELASVDCEPTRDLY
jgi:RNA polymerase sigma factor (sigma-70 family)